MWKDGYLECWACGDKKELDGSYSRPKIDGWGNKPIAGSIHMLCPQCISLLRLEGGTMSHYLIDDVYKNHGIKLDSYGNVLEE